MVSLLLALAASTTLSGSPLTGDGQQPTGPSRYDDCVMLLEADLEIGRIAAQQWTQEGGGAEAQHCLAIADAKAGFPKLSAVRLEEIAERKDAGDDYVRARILAQATEMWLTAGKTEAAAAALAKATALTPDSGELKLTAAKVFTAQERWHDAIAAVDAAEEAGFVAASAFVDRGRARYRVGDYQAAAEDVVAALTLDPVNIDALVLRGDLQQTGIVIDVFYESPDAAQ